MNKTGIKNFAVWARLELIKAVTQRAYEYNVTKEGENDPAAEVISGRPLTANERAQRRKLIDEIARNGYEQTIETAAYTWFNRFIALRYMEVNGYLPDRVRVFTDENGEFKPEILKEAANVDLPGIDPDTVTELLDAQENETLYKMLLIACCNLLGESLPQMFEKIADWTELLFPRNLLRTDGIIAHMVTDIPEDDWKDAVQIIGWLYQYYISEKHEEIVNIYKGTVKKDDIPAATQLFTTDWVVRYMVDNSLGRYWIERHPESRLADSLAYFVRPKSGKINYVDDPIKPQELTFFDPCMGSGHILVYAFEVLMEIYKECGYSERDAAVEIVRNNLYGLDIDERCSQLAYFVVMMKGRSYDRRFLTRGIVPNILAIHESNRISQFTHPQFMPDRELNAISEYLLETFRDAKEIGSLKTAKKYDYDAFKDYLDSRAESATPGIEFSMWESEEKTLFEQMTRQAKVLSGKYAVVCTNPPYMNKLEGELKKFVLKEYKAYSGDLFSTFIFHNFEFCKKDGYSAFMTPFVWMFIKTYENLREYILEQKSLTTLIQMEYSAFEEATVPICSFVLQNCKSTNKSLCFRLSDFKGGMEVQRIKTLQAIEDPECGYFYEADQANFSKIPGSPVAYWLTNRIFEIYASGMTMNNVAHPKVGMQTSNNDKYLRLWYEVNYSEFNGSSMGKKWIKYLKGGNYRKWYQGPDIIDLLVVDDVFDEDRRLTPLEEFCCNIEDISTVENLTYTVQLFEEQSCLGEYKKVENGVWTDLSDSCPPADFDTAYAWNWYPYEVIVTTDFDYDKYPEIVKALQDCVKKHLPEIEFESSKLFWDAQEHFLIYNPISWTVSSLAPVKAFFDEVNSILKPIMSECRGEADSAEWFQTVAPFNKATCKWTDEGFVLSIGPNC